MARPAAVPPPTVDAMSGMKPHHIARLASAGAVRLAPDGRLAAFTITSVDQRANRYRSRVWVADTAGGNPWPVSAGTERDEHPVWSPDGRQLAWVTKVASGDRIVSTMAVGAPGSAGQPARFDDEVEELAWSPDGRRLAVVVRDRDRDQYGPEGAPLPPDRMPPRRITTLLSRLNGEGFVSDRPAHVYLVDLEVPGEPVLVTPGPWEARNVAWSPQGTTLAWSSGRHDGWDMDLCRDLWTVRVDGPIGVPERVTPTDASYFAPSWSPDGTRLAFLVVPTPMNEPRHGQVGVLVAAEGASSLRVLSSDLDRNAAPHEGPRPPAWLGDDLVFSAEDAGALRLWSVPSDGSAPPALWLGGDRRIVSWDVSGPAAQDAIVAFSAGDALHLPEFHVAPLSPGGAAAGGRLTPGAERRVTELTASLRAEATLVEPERFVATSADGTEVECWAMAPLDAGPGRHPTILNIHGGPFTQYGHVLFDEFQLQAAHGYGVVYCNPRGSSGYSEAWGRAVRWPEAGDDAGSGWGGVDADDVLACVEEAADRFEWVDADRLGIQGGSYGGYLTSWIIGHDDRFTAAVSERAVNNLMTMESDSDIAGFFAAYVGHDHLQRPELFARHSPITHVSDMTTPVLIVHSENDLRCPMSQAEELFVALKLLGRHPELVRFPEETHELSRSGSPAHRVMRAELILEWFDRYLR